jgi:plasmid stabilization system protein ParE
MNVEISEDARDDLDEIYLLIRENSPAAAERFCNGLLTAAATLRSFPRRCPLAPESSATLEIRQLLHGAYRILFTIARHTVYVLRIRHGARRPLIVISFSIGDESGDG